MPLAIWVVVRAARALGATAQLLADRRLLRGLPWPYVRRLPLRDRWLGLLTLTVPLTLLAALVTAAGPTHHVRTLAWTVALCAAGLGIGSSWLRALGRRARRP